MNNKATTSRRRLLQISALTGGATLLSLLAACAPAAAPTAPPSATKAAAPAAAPTAADKAATPAAGAAPAKAPVEIIYQHRDSAVEDFVRKTFAPRFTQETGIKVTIQEIPSAEIWTKLPILASAGQLGDALFAYVYPYQQIFAAKNMIRPIDDYVKADNYDLSVFYKGVIDAGRFQGKLLGLPNTGHHGAVNIHYNKDMFAEAGVTLPDAKFPADAWKFEDILAAAQKLTKTTGGKTNWGWLPIRNFVPWGMGNLRSFGSDMLSEDGKTSLAGNDQGKAAYRYYHDLIYKHKVAPSPADIPGNQMDYFVSGQLAMFQEAVVFITTMENYVKGKFKWGIFPIPAGPGGDRGTNTNGNTAHVSAQAKQPEAAWQFLKYISSQEAGVTKLLMGSGSPGARPDVYQDKKVTDAYPWYTVGHKVMSEAKPPRVPANVRISEIMSAVPQVEDQIWLNKVGPEEGAVLVQKTIQDILNQPQ